MHKSGIRIKGTMVYPSGRAPALIAEWAEAQVEAKLQEGQSISHFEATPHYDINGRIFIEYVFTKHNAGIVGGRR